MPRTRVKFCGMMRPIDAVAAAAAGADAVGMILHANARRRIDLDTARRIVSALPPYVAAVGVVVDAPAAFLLEAALTLGLSHVQLHGDETPDDVARPPVAGLRVVKCLKVDAAIETTLALWRHAVADGRVPNLVGILLDSASGGGTGTANDFSRVRDLIDRGLLVGLPPVTVAGGLHAGNVVDVVARLRPYAVDTSSGIEAVFGEKSVEKMRAFVAAVALAPSPGTPGEGGGGSLSHVGCSTLQDPLPNPPPAYRERE